MPNSNCLDSKIMRVTFSLLVFVAIQVNSTIVVERLPPVVYPNQIYIGQIFSTSSSRPRISIFVILHGSSKDSLTKIDYTTEHLDDASDEVADYYSFSIAGFKPELRYEDKFKVIIGCSKEWEAIPINDDQLGGIESIPIGVSEMCRIYTLNDDNVKMTNIVKGMPEIVMLYLDKDGSTLALEFVVLVETALDTVKRNWCREIETIPLFKAVYEYYTAMENIVDLPVVTVASKDGEPGEAIGILVEYKGKPMLYSTVKCGVPMRARALKEDEFIYSFKRGDLDCFAISQIPEEQKHVVGSFNLQMIGRNTLSMNLVFGDFTDRSPKMDLAITLYVDGCPAAYRTRAPVGIPDVDGLGESISTEDGSEEIDLSEFTLTNLAFGEITLKGETFEKTSDALSFAEFPSATTVDKFYATSFIRGSPKELIERVVVHYERRDDLANSVILVLSVLHKDSKTQEVKYIDGFGLAIVCGHGDIDRVKSMAQLGDKCLVRWDLIRPKKLTVVESGKRTKDDVSIVEFNIKDGEGGEFIWRISNSAIAFPAAVDNPNPNNGKNKKDLTKKAVTTPVVADSGKGQDPKVSMEREQIKYIPKAQHEPPVEKATETNKVGGDGPRPPVATSTTGGQTPMHQQGHQKQKNKHQEKTATQEVPETTTGKRHRRTTSNELSAQPTNAIQAPTSTKVASTDQAGPAKAALTGSSTSAASSSSTPKKNTASVEISSLPFLIVAIVAALI